MAALSSHRHSRTGAGGSSLEEKSTSVPNNHSDDNNGSTSSSASRTRTSMNMKMVTVPGFLVPKKNSKRGAKANNGGNTASTKVKGKKGKSDSSSSQPSSSSIPPLMKQADDEAITGGISTTTSMAGPETNNSSAMKYSPLKSKGNHDPTAPYALHHDQIVTALIDDALRNRKDEGAGNDNNNLNGVDELQATPSQSSTTPVGESKPDNSNNNHKSRSSPHRIKRNGMGGGGSNSSSSTPGIHLLRKRQRSNSGGKLNSSPLPASTTNNSTLLSQQQQNHHPSEFLHPDCILQKKKGSEQKLLLKPPRLSFATMSSSTIIGGGSSSSNITNNSNNNDEIPSAIGREETLIKLQQKLSMLSDIESGKYGMAVEMLRSDAVAFIAQTSNDPGSSANGGSGMGHGKKLMSSSTTPPLPRGITKVETRSILTLRMGFVSMSYGILLQWDCATRLVELIVLRKMCRDDFLHGANNNDASASSTSTTAIVTTKESNNVLSGTKSNAPLAEAQRHPSLPELIPAPAFDSRATTTAGGGEVGSTSATTADPHKIAIPRLIHPPNPLAYLPRLMSSGGGGGGGSGVVGVGGGANCTSGASTSTTTTKPQYLLSVSALSVTQLHSVCENCRNSDSFLGKMMNGAQRNQTPTTTTVAAAATVRPYIRFALGEYEHCTKVTKFKNGNATWTKRHHNSCLLPCRPEEVRWFAGREDLTVEVRNERKQPSSSSSSSKRSRGGSAVGGSGDANVSNQQQHAALWPPRLLFGAPNDENNDSSSIANHPILATVTVPLSSVNIEDEDSIGVGRGSWRRRGGKTKDGPSSTNITIPLRMNCCQSAPIGSISLRITIKVTTPGGGNSGSGSGGGGGGGVNNSSYNLYALARPNIQVDISVSGDGGNGEPKVSESIELGPLTRLMDGWSLGGGGGSVREVVDTKERTTKGRKAAKSSGVQQQQLENKSSFSWPEILTSSTATNDEEGEKTPTRINWSKKLDHQTKKWSALKLNRTETPTTPDDVDAGWFAFLRGGTRDTVDSPGIL